MTSYDLWYDLQLTYFHTNAANNHVLRAFGLMMWEVYGQKHLLHEVPENELLSTLADKDKLEAIVKNALKKPFSDPQVTHTSHGDLITANNGPLGTKSC